MMARAAALDSGMANPVLQQQEIGTIKKDSVGVPKRFRIQRAGYPAGLKLPHQTNSGTNSRARALARRDHGSSP